MSDILSRLAAPFPPNAVSWRVGSTNKDRTKGMALAYIDARDVQGRLDEVLGADWADELVVQQGLVTCRIGIFLDGTWRWRQDGTASVREKDKVEADAKAEQQREMSLKGSASDAFKRAAVKWGIGRYIYALPSPWVEVEQKYDRGPVEIKDGERPKLTKILERHYSEWMRVQGGPVSAPRQPQQSAAPAPRQEDDAPEPGSHEPDEYVDGDGVVMDRETILTEMRKNEDYQRIETLLTRNGKTLGDVNRIINAENNLAAMKSWPAHWQAVMRERIKDARRIAEGNRPPAEQAA